jgi:hypothetical protein
MKTAAIILATVVITVAGIKLFDRLSSSSTQAQTGRFTQAEHKARQEAFRKKFSYYMRLMKETEEFERKTRSLLYGETASGTVAILESDLADAKKNYSEYSRRWGIAVQGQLRSWHWIKHGTENGEYVELDDIDPETL